LGDLTKGSWKICDILWTLTMGGAPRRVEEALWSGPDLSACPNQEKNFLQGTTSSRARGVWVVSYQKTESGSDHLHTLTRSRPARGVSSIYLKKERNVDYPSPNGFPRGGEKRKVVLSRLENPGRRLRPGIFWGGVPIGPGEERKQASFGGREDTTSSTDFALTVKYLTKHPK